MSAILLEMKEITKTFASVKALTTASFQLKKGEVHALLGANGAGKSTLMKILSGVYGYDEGAILMEGNSIHIRSPKDSKNHGIYCVYQEVDTAIVPQLTVAENILLDSFSSGKGLFVSKGSLEKKAMEALELLNVEISVQKQASELTLAEKQMLLITRALVHEAKIIIFDEPTAPLSIEETKHFFSIVRRLKKQGVGCIFISHRLPEVFELSDRITVMRDGKTVATFPTSDVNQQIVIESMLGNTFIIEKFKKQAQIGETLLRVENLSDGKKVKNITFSVSKGETVGVVGLVGAGKTELAKILFGLTPSTSGKVKLSGKTLKLKHPGNAIEAGIALIPEERRKEGLFIEESIRGNLSFPHLKKFSRFLFMNKKQENNHADQVIGTLGIKAKNSEALVLQLSGGNQQKVAIGKWLSRDAELYLFDEPTKGVDIGAKKDIFQLIHNLTESGKGVLYFSCEINEILGIADRILVMYDGEIVKELSKEEATQDKILLYASGGKEEIYEGETH